MPSGDKGKNDAALRELATRYLSAYGEQLERELEDMERLGTARTETPALDWKVKKAVNAHRRKPFARALVVLAACFALLVMLPQLNWMLSRTGEGTPPQEAGGMASESAIPSPGEDGAPGEQPSVESGATGMPERIPLSVSLPEEFRVAAEDLDHGKSIYYLEHEKEDDVVLTMEMPLAQPNFGGLLQLEISGREAYAYSGGSYNLLTFEQEDILYTMTCKYDVNTLVELSQHIVTQL